MITQIPNYTLLWLCKVYSFSKMTCNQSEASEECMCHHKDFWSINFHLLFFEIVAHLFLNNCMYLWLSHDSCWCKDHNILTVTCKSSSSDEVGCKKHLFYIYFLVQWSVLNKKLYNFITSTSYNLLYSTFLIA